MSNLDYEINKELGECYLFMGELDKAEDYYRKAMSSNGVHPEPYLGLATICVQRGQLGEALGYYARAAEVTPSDKALAGMGLIEAEQGDHGEAFEHFRQALDLNPENPIALFGLVREGHGLGQLEEVAARLNACLELDPAKVEARYSLAGTFMAMGREAEAGAELDRIIAERPDFAPARELKGELKAA